MAGKAEKPSNMLTAARFMDMQTGQNYGLLRSQDEGAPRQRSYSIGTANNDLKLAEKLSVQGGVMLGSLGFKGVATDELTASGILDTSDYNCPRLYITNTTLYDLKVLIPTIKDGQELWIRNNSASAFNITNTSGTGNETTGNIELMAGTTYALGIDDWICFHYDATDSKFKQVTAGRNNIGGGGGSGEVFTWSASHSAAGFNLNDIGILDFLAGGSTITGSGLGLFYNTAAGLNHDFTITGTGVVASISSAGLTLSGNLAIVGSISAVTGSINVTGNISTSAGLLSLPSGNTIGSDGSGNLEYRLGSSSDDHQFFCGSEFFRLDGGTNQAHLFVPLLMGNNGIFECTKIESGTGSGNTLNLSSGISLESATGTFNMSDATGLFLATLTTDVTMLRNFSPFTSALNLTLGSSSREWNGAFFQGDVKFSTGGTVDFYDIDSTAKSTGGAAALPANPTSYFAVKYRGATRYIPYYSA